MWVATDSLPEFFSRPVAAILADGKVLAVDAASSPTAAVYDPRSGRWSPSGPMVQRYQSLSVTTCADGQVLVVGASPFDPVARAHWPQAELYDPAGGSWRAVRPMAAPRFGHSATLLPDGRVLVVGGTVYTASSYLTANTAELYDPAANTWLPAGAMQWPRVGHAACSLGSGAVLIVGGSSDATTGISAATAELYSAASGTSGTWQVVDSMLVPRPSGHQVTPFGVGGALVTGCLRTVGPNATPVELFSTK